MSKQQPRSNGHKPGAQPPTHEIRDELDMYERVLQSSDANPLLQDTNLGLGNYDKSFLWQQIESYRKGLFAWVAFGRVLTRRAIHETKMKLGYEGINYYDDDVEEVFYARPLDDADDKGQHEYPRTKYEGDGELPTPEWEIAKQRGEDIWQSLGRIDEAMTRKQWVAVAKKTGLDDDFQPLFWDMVSGRHEASRSKDAELLRDTTKGAKDLREHAVGDDSGGILG